VVDVLGMLGQEEAGGSTAAAGEQSHLHQVVWCIMFVCVSFHVSFVNRCGDVHEAIGWRQHVQPQQLGSSWLQLRVQLMCWGCWDRRKLASALQQQQVRCVICIKSGGAPGLHALCDVSWLMCWG
jgi:hypothetical protein